MIVCVLGMHKSGTTLVAEMLHHSGVHMADVPEHLGYDASNTFERHETQTINRDLLDDVSIPTLRAWLKRSAEPLAAGYPLNADSISIVLRGRLRDRLRTASVDPLRTLAERLDDRHGRWGFKDPRTCLTYCAWMRALPDHRVVAVYRPFDEVLTRYGVEWMSPVRLARVVHSYLLHNEMLVEHLARRSGDHVVVRYDEVMRDGDELARLSEYVGLPLVDRREPTMYRARSTPTDGELPVRLPRAVVDRVRSVEAALDAHRSR